MEELNNKMISAAFDSDLATKRIRYADKSCRLPSSGHTGKLAGLAGID